MFILVLNLLQVFIRVYVVSSTWEAKRHRKPAQIYETSTVIPYNAQNKQNTII